MHKRWILALLLLLTACKRQRTIIPTSTPTLPSPTPTFTPVVFTPTPMPVVHVVQPGESLSVIAFKYGVPMEAIVEANAISDPNVIQAGQKLVIPGPTPIPTATVPPTPTPTPNIPPKLEIVEVIGRGAPTAETVVLANQGRDLSLEQWTLRDAQGDVFMFPKLYLASGTEVRVHTGKGENTPLHLYWNRDTAVWEESGDTAILADDRGVVYASKPLD